MEVTLLGTGDTTGTPTVGCGCETCLRARELGVERTRFSVHVTGESGTLLVDFSPDFRHQFLREEVSLPDAAVVTHIHFDHLHGAGNVFRLCRDLPVYAPAETDPQTGESVAETVARQYDYLDAIDARGRTPLEPFRAAGFEVEFVPVDHPPLLCYGLVVREPATGATLALTGDTSFDVPAASRNRLGGADLLLADGIVHAGFCDDHPRGGRHHDDRGTPRTFASKHMTIEGAEQLAADLAPDRYRLVHVSHFVPADRAFTEPLAVDGERYTL
jgi:phosphoribosyl 1,2-cyclic phosphate phosphodiesterase